MKKLNTMDVCRLCLVRDKALSELTQYLTNIISTCFSLKISLSPKLTNKICPACVDQLVKVYKYRKKIIKNENKLLRILKENDSNYSAKVYSKDSLKDSDIDVVNDNIVIMNLNEFIMDISGEESDTNSDINDNEELNSEIVKQDKHTSKSVKDSTEETGPKLESNIENIFRDSNESNKELNNFKIDKDNNRENDLNDLHRDQRDAKVNSDMIKTEITEDSIINKENIQENEDSTSIHSMKFESVDQYNSQLETDKENADINNLSNNNLTDNKYNPVFKDEDIKASIVLNQNELCAFDPERKFMCLTCLNDFESQKELSIHYKTVELPKAMKETSRKFSNPDIVQISKNDEDKTMFKCNICTKVFENKTSALKHTQVHKIERPFLCNLCGRTYKTADDILRHGVVHNGNKFACSYDCGYTTVHLGALRDHVKRHKKEYKYKCEKCDKCFQVKTWYEQHQNVHDKVRPFVCTICGQAFSMARYLTSHRANVHPQSSGVKRYKCVDCGLPCDSPKSLGLHMKQKHGLKTDCLCDICGQILSDQHKLSLHKTTHRATKKYSCRFCKKTFTKNDHRTVHEKIHTGERLNCNSCPKSFTQRCSLRRHIKRYHPGDLQSLEQKT